MRIVVAGASPLGRATAKKMIDAKKDVVLIDRDRDKLDELSDSLDCGLVHGDCTLPSTLREAGGDDPQVLFALTNSDEDNILSAVVGRSIGFQRVVPQIIKPELCAICEELELKDVITPHETVAASLVDAIDDAKNPDHASSLTGDLRLAEYTISGRLEGKTIDELDDLSAYVIAVRRGDVEQMRGEAGVLQAQDTLILITRRDGSQEIAKQIKSRDTT